MAIGSTKASRRIFEANKKPHERGFFVLLIVIPGRALARTRNLEIPGLVLRTIPE
jgi:hypothetical protein